MSRRTGDVFRMAEELYEQKPDWIVFFREVLGVDGIIRRIHRTPQEMAQFEKTQDYAQIKQMLADLRRRVDESEVRRENIRMVTVRMPESIHELLKAEAVERRISVNQLCITKLLTKIDAQEDLGRRQQVGASSKFEELSGDL